MIRKIKQIAKKKLYAALGLRADISIPVQTVNPGDQAWYFAKGSLKPADIVYSLGLATNIEFDLNLICDSRVEVHGFDPTPDSVEWIQMQKLPPQFHHHPIAVAGHDGELEFALPSSPGHCARAVTTPRQLSPSIRVPCRRISTLMRELGHNRIDLLKMDIEGSEYDVIKDILSNRLDIPQIIVEFHHRFSGIGMRKTLDSVAALRQAGYQLFHISPWCEEYAFIKQ
jgi:FkbM family methyltransferase